MGNTQEIGILHVAKSIADIQASTHGNYTQYPIGFDFDGKLIDLRIPWLKTGLPTRDGIRLAVLNFYLLELLHNKLFEFYKQIDHARFRAADRNDVLDSEAQQAEIAASMQVLAEPDTVQTPQQGVLPGEKRQRLPSLRSERLFLFLEKEFRCQIRPGKGSEVVIWREGGKNFIVGHHKPNFEVHPIQIERMLKRLNIGREEWRKAIYK